MNHLVACAIAFACGACSAASPRSIERVANEAPAQDLAGLIESAERAVGHSARLNDYGLPFANPGAMPLAVASDLFTRACERGDAPSCWRAHAILRPFTVADYIDTDAIQRNCQAGDFMSCRDTSLCCGVKKCSCSGCLSFNSINKIPHL